MKRIGTLVLAASRPPSRRHSRAARHRRRRRKAAGTSHRRSMRCGWTTTASPTTTPASRWRSAARSTPTGTRRSRCSAPSIDRAGGDSLELQGFGALRQSRVLSRRPRESLPEPRRSPRTKSILKPGRRRDRMLTALYGGGLLINLGAVRDDGRAVQLRADLGARRGSRATTTGREARRLRRGSRAPVLLGRLAPRRRVLDTDGDGVTDDLDKCPAHRPAPRWTRAAARCRRTTMATASPTTSTSAPGTPAGAKVDASGCELDSDGDGVGDSRDQCPNTPGRRQGRRARLRARHRRRRRGRQRRQVPRHAQGRSRGCRSAARSRKRSNYPAWCSRPARPISSPRACRCSKARSRRSSVIPSFDIEVAGHTDSRGSDAFNLDLSARRAETVLKYLNDGGVTNTLTVARIWRAPAGRQQQQRRWPSAEPPRRVARPQLTAIVSVLLVAEVCCPPVQGGQHRRRARPGTGATHPRRPS